MNKYNKFQRLMAISLLLCVSSPALTNDLKLQKNDDSRAPEVQAKEADVSFSDLPYLGKAFIDVAPENKNDFIKVGELGVDGGNKSMIIALANEIASNQHANFDSLLISHKGKLIFESYYKRGRVNLPHRQASTTKSYLSLAIGRAIQMGYLSMSDLDKPLVSFFKELDETKFVHGAQSVTLHKALSMQSGARISGEKMYEIEKNPSLVKGQAQVQIILEHSEVITSEIQRFKYQNTDPRFVMQVLNAVVPGSVKDFIKTEVLDKMGISNYSWDDDISGLPKAPYGSNMTSRDMVKWGTLVKNNGNWNGEQLISKAFMSKATNRVAHPSAEEAFFVGENVIKPGYGYFFWQADMKVGDKTYFTRSAQGGGGQYIIIIDELDLIVVTTAHQKEDNTMKFTAERVLPAFTQLMSE